MQAKCTVLVTQGRDWYGYRAWQLAAVSWQLQHQALRCGAVQVAVANTVYMFILYRVGRQVVRTVGRLVVGCAGQSRAQTQVGKKPALCQSVSMLKVSVSAILTRLRTSALGFSGDMSVLLTPPLQKHSLGIR